MHEITLRTVCNIDIIYPAHSGKRLTEVYAMEIQRKIYQHLLRWKEETNGKKALLIEGARRVGKSTIAEKFAKEQYKSYILVDFNLASRNVRDNFENLNQLDVFFQNLSLEYNVRLYPRESLIIFDEIQKFPRAREAIKYLVSDGRYDYIETGSLISIKENVHTITIPSEERKLKMYPVDFEEFLWAMGEELLAEHIRSCCKEGKAPEQKTHAKAMRLFREYMLVGGMPQSIVSYIEGFPLLQSSEQSCFRKACPRSMTGVLPGSPYTTADLISHFH